MSIEQKIIRNLELEIERLHGRVNDAGDSLREYMSLVRYRDEEIERLQRAIIEEYIPINSYEAMLDRNKKIYRNVIDTKDAEIERLNSENTLLRTGDTCARHCEGVAFRHEAQRLKADNQRLEDFVSGMKRIANTQGEIIAEQNEKIEERDGVLEMILLRELRLRELLTDAQRVLEWGEPEPKPVLRRIEAALNTEGK